MFEPVIAPSGTLLGLLQRGRGDGTLHALTAPRPEALAALNHCVLRDPRHDWQVENRSLYYARLYLDLNGELDAIEAHLFGAEDVLDTDESRTGLALAVLGHLASYGRRDALELLRRYAAHGSNWAWALDELALRDDDAGLRALAAPVLARFPADPEGDAELAATVRDAFEPRPWRLWAEDPRESIATRVRAAHETGCFDRWQRQMRPTGPRPGWSVRAVFEWAQQGLERGAALHVPAARCLTAVAGPEDRAEIVQAAKDGGDGARCTALRYLADGNDPDALGLIEDAVATGSTVVVDAAVDAFERMRSLAGRRAGRRRTPPPRSPRRAAPWCRGSRRAAVPGTAPTAAPRRPLPRPLRCPCCPRKCSIPPPRWWPELATSPWKTSAPRTPPTGSMREPSQMRMCWSRSVGRTKLRSGPTTVGPETTRIVPIMTAARHDMPSSGAARTVPSSPVVRTPIQISRTTTRRVWPFSLARSSPRPAS
ncbi:hypothetical protein SVIOM74S_09834 [Streptomyces violarus]